MAGLALSQSKMPRLWTLAALLLIYLDNVSSYGQPTFDVRRVRYGAATSSKKLLAVNQRFSQSKKLSLRMSDISDMTMEMLKRLERDLDQLSETDLIRVSFIARLS